MKKLTEVDNIWMENITKNDIEVAKDYSTTSLPWTFDRMQYGGNSQNGINQRIMNILKGVLNQNILERKLTKKGYKCSKDWTNYRESDVFDFSVDDKIFDVKTVHVYSEYSDNCKRKKLSPNLIIKYRSYPGPEWRKFFPIGPPVTQITPQIKKDSYIFGIAETWKDINKIVPERNDGGFWVTVPFGKSFNFFQNTKVILAREDDKSGFQVRISWKKNQQTFNDNEDIEVTLFGEWKAHRQTEKIIISLNENILSKKEYSSLSCIKFNHPAKLSDYDFFNINVENNYSKFIPKITNPTINLNDNDFVWQINKSSFVNLNFPNDYKVYWTGHISIKEFAKLILNYRPYFIPHPNNPDVNTAGILTPKNKQKFQAIDNRTIKAQKAGKKVHWPIFLEHVKNNNPNFGVIIAAQMGARPIGAACYYYPPYALRESALYVLPKDLYIMGDL